MPPKTMPGARIAIRSRMNDGNGERRRPSDRRRSEELRSDEDKHSILGRGVRNEDRSNATGLSATGRPRRNSMLLAIGDRRPIGIARTIGRPHKIIAALRGTLHRSKRDARPIDVHPSTSGAHRIVNRLPSSDARVIAIRLAALGTLRCDTMPTRRGAARRPRPSRHNPHPRSLRAACDSRRG